MHEPLIERIPLLEDTDRGFDPSSSHSVWYLNDRFLTNPIPVNELQLFFFSDPPNTLGRGINYFAIAVLHLYIWGRTLLP